MDVSQSIQTNAPLNVKARKSRMLRMGRWLLCFLLCILFVVAWALADDVRTLSSLRQIAGTNAYVMDYYCDYHLEKLRDGMDVGQTENELIDAYFPWYVSYVAKRVRESFVPTNVRIQPGDTEFCSTVAYRNAQGHTLLGRNLDWKHNACLVLRVHRAGQLESVSVIDLQYLNMNREDLIETWLWERIPLLFSPYYLQDGMNSHGVAISDMTLEGSRPPRDPSKPNLIHSTAMRLVLDDTQSTVEAIGLLQKYNVHFGETPCHFMIADASGQTAVVEYLEGQMRVSRREGAWQVCTNRQIWGATEEECDANCDRYQRASSMLEGLDGEIGVEEIMNVMDKVAVNDWTMWSTVYNLTTGELLLTHRKGSDRNKRTRIDLN